MSVALSSSRRDAPQPDLGPAIARAGDNCWCVERADRFRCVQDGADYFRWVRRAILEARHSIFIVGWDIQANLDLIPDAPPDTSDDMPRRLDRLLAYVARRRPHLRCYVLIWDHAALYTLERDPLARWRLGWRMPRQVRFGFDDHHPVGGSHHQKIVVVDDALAFCGGIDLTGHRWDTTAHRVDEPVRKSAMGKPYGPYHEVQAMLSGPAATRLGALVRGRWQAVGEKLRPAQTAATDLWPADVLADLVDVDVAIARTMPASEQGPAVRECEQLFVDSIAAARNAIYLESQYFTNDTLGAALAGRLREPDGPEALIVVPEKCEGWLERQTMGALREGVLRQLVAADRYGRLRLVYPAASQAADVPTFVHSKVMIVDDVLARIGSANFSRRSMGVDTECDVAVDAGGNADARAGVLRIRDRLIAEHLGITLETVTDDLARLGSLRAVVDARSTADRTLVRVELAADPETPTDVVQAAADPDEPIGFTTSVAEWIPPLDARADRGMLRLWLPVVIAVAAVVALAPTIGLERIRAWFEAGPGLVPAPAIAIAVFLVAHAALVPLELLAAVGGLLLGMPQGVLIAVLGAWIAAALGYLAGRALTPATLSRWMTWRAYRSARQLGARGVGGVVILRLVSIASAGSVHLLCGAAAVPLGTYLIGSLLGLTPVVVALSTVGALVRAAILQPSWATVVTAAGAAVVVAGLAVALRTALLLRQFTPAVSRHRERAEFG